MNPTARVLEQVREFFVCFVVLPAPEYADAIALWVLHTYAIGAADTTPRLVFKSAEKQSGKTRALEVLDVLTMTPLATINSSVAALFHLIGGGGVTVLFDEVDSIFGPKAKEHEDLRALLNAGYRRGATVARMSGEGSKMKVKRYPVFAPAALAGIGDLPDTIEDRAILVPMKRRSPDETVAPFRRRRVEAEAEEIKGQLLDWSVDHLDRLRDYEPSMPEELSDRAADCWEPLLAIAELAGEEWAKKAREAAKAIANGKVAEERSLGVRLLRDIREVFDFQRGLSPDFDRFSSATLCHRLNALAESPWGGFSEGRGIDQRGLAWRLKGYGIEPKVINLLDGNTARGYHRENFLDAWSRYVR